jgi:putative inorganic carbon (HCO3(-)) transporter
MAATGARLPWSADRGRRFVLLAGVLTAGAALALLTPLEAGAVLAGGAAVWYGVSRPPRILALVLLAIPLEFVVLNVGLVGLSAVQLVMMLTVALMLVEMLARGRLEIARTPLDVPIFLWLAVGFLSSIDVTDPAAAIKKAGMTIVLAGVYYFVVAKVRRLDTVQALMRSLVAACAGVGAYGIWVSYRYIAQGVVTHSALIVGSEGLTVPRASSTVGDPTLLAGLMVIAIPIAVGLVVVERGWKRLAAYGALAIILVALGLTFTRGAWIGGVVGLAVLLLERRARVVLLIVALAVLLAAPGAVADRAATSTDTSRAEISHRFDYWQGALLVANQHPLFGVGINNFQYAFARLRVAETAQRTAIHAHNIVLVLLSETGIVGLMVFGSYLAVVLWMLLRRRRGDPCSDRRVWRIAIAAAIVGSLAHQMSDSFLLEPTVNAVLWIFAGLAVLFAAGMIDDGSEVRALRGAE